MSQSSDSVGPIIVDRVSNVLKWILLAVAVVSFALFAWATVLTYERAPPQPDRLVTSERHAADDERGHRRRKGRISKGRSDGLREPLRHGLLLRPGLHGLDADPSGRAGRAQSRTNRPSASHTPSYPQTSRRRSVTRCAEQLQRIDLTQRQVTVPDALASSHQHAARAILPRSLYRPTSIPAGHRLTASTRRIGPAPPTS